MSDSLQDQFSGLGDGEFKDWVCETYSQKLKDEILMGEPLDIPDVSTSIRKYDHGQADGTQVTEYGVKLVFDPAKVNLSSLKSGGSIRSDIKQRAEKLISAPVEKLDLSLVTEDAYELWVILDVDSL